MFKKLRLLSITAAILFSTTSASAALEGLECLSPYVGVDAQFRSMPFARDYGANVFKKRFPQGNVFAGIQCNDYLGFEVGYEASVKTHQTANLTRNQMVFGFPANLVHSRNSTAQIYGPHLNLMGYYPLWGCSNIQLIGTLGVACLKVRLSSDIITELSPITGIVRNVSGTDISSFSQTKFVARAGTGVQHFFNDCVGMRGMVIWENTKRFNHLLDKNPNFPTDFVKLKDSLILSLGVFIKF